MSDEVTKVKRIRGVYRGGITRTMSQAETILQDEINEEGRNKLIALRNSMVDKLAKVKEMDGKLETLLIEMEGDAFETEVSETLDYHDPIYELFVAIENKLVIKGEVAKG